MTWWKRSLYDTCSLITLDKLLQIRETMERHFPKTIIALEQSFSADQLRPETAKRMRTKATIQELPSIHDLAIVFSSTTLSPALAEVDKLIYAVAVHFELSVVTADRPLGRALHVAGVQVTDVASILRDLVYSEKLSEKSCERLLDELAQQNDLILGTPTPKWSDLESHSFPDRSRASRKKNILKLGSPSNHRNGQG